MAKQGKKGAGKPIRKKRVKKSTVMKTSKAQKPTATKARKAYLSKDTKKRIKGIAKESAGIAMLTFVKIILEAIEQTLQKKGREPSKPKSRKSEALHFDG